MSDEDWESGFGKSVAVYLNGLGIPDLDPRGQRVTDDSFVLCFNAHDEPIDFTLPPTDFGQAWLPVFNTADLVPAVVGPTPIKAGATVRVESRATMVLQAASPG
jgi:glycogen operon protein